MAVTILSSQLAADVAAAMQCDLMPEVAVVVGGQNAPHLCMSSCEPATCEMGVDELANTLVSHPPNATP